MFLRVMLDNLLVLLKHPATWVLASLLAIAAFVYQYVDEAKTTKDNLDNLKVQYEASVEKINTLQREREAQALAMEAITKRNKVIWEERNRAIKQLEKFKDREDVVRSKPDLVERRANAATDRLFYQIACSTGSETDCKRTATKPARLP